MNFMYLVLTLSFVIFQNDISGVKEENGNNEEKGRAKDSLKIDYCAINEEHILCGANGPSVLREGLKVIFPKNDTHRDMILDFLNRERNITASGSLIRGNFSPQAANMFELEWSTEFENAALNAMKHCREDLTYRNCCNCMNTGKTDISSEKLNIPKSVYHIESLPDVLDTILKPLSNKELHFLCFKNVTEECMKIYEWFYLRLMIAGSVQIGCAFVQCFNPKYSRPAMSDNFVSCVSNLDDFKDIINHPIYKQGSSCSSCPKGSSCSEKYNQLCKCKKISDCLITPSELKSECTERKTVTKDPSLITSTPSKKTKQAFELPNIKIDFPSETTVATTTTRTNTNATTTTTQKTGDSGGDQDKSGGFTFSCFENFVISFILSAAVFIN